MKLKVVSLSNSNLLNICILAGFQPSENVVDSPSDSLTGDELRPVRGTCSPSVIDERSVKDAKWTLATVALATLAEISLGRADDAY